MGLNLNQLGSCGRQQKVSRIHILFSAKKKNITKHSQKIQQILATAFYITNSVTENSYSTPQSFELMNVSNVDAKFSYYTMVSSNQYFSLTNSLMASISYFRSNSSVCTNM